MKFYLLKLVPPRPSFAADLTPAEASLMQAHGLYWRGLLDRGLAAAFGLVGDPRGAYGIGIVELPDDGDPHALAADDPVIKGAIGMRYEIHPMPRAVVRPAANALSPAEQMERFAKELKENDWGHQPC